MPKKNKGDVDLFDCTSNGFATGFKIDVKGKADIRDCESNECETGFDIKAGELTSKRNKVNSLANAVKKSFGNNPEQQRNTILEDAIKKPLGGEISSSPFLLFLMNHLAAFVVGFLLLIIAIFFLEPFQQELQDNKSQKGQVTQPKQV